MADGQTVTSLHLGGLALFHQLVCAQGQTSTLELSQFCEVHMLEALLLNNQFHSATVKGYHICYIGRDISHQTWTI
ncbi:hypothetical protein MUK42_31707 [Musa troglodytarum]|uniref:Uncharacterized protein n=1 Tax=Musa troglodytarum TaxID=320322 RepID=A0A9E7JYF3_9LILI|nr:hypothetical protein MUK42_31707 [Musa troglodytarum]